MCIFVKLLLISDCYEANGFSCSFLILHYSFFHFFFVIIRQDLWFDFIRKISNRKILYQVITYLSAKTIKYNRKNYKIKKMY